MLFTFAIFRYAMARDYCHTLIFSRQAARRQAASWLMMP
jgi:hypothetical protein